MEMPSYGPDRCTMYDHWGKGNLYACVYVPASSRDALCHESALTYHLLPIIYCLCVCLSVLVCHV